MNQRLYDLLIHYKPRNEQEAGDQKVMLEYIETFADVTTRNNHFGHFSASPWIINQDFTKVLMAYHHIYQSWGWLGGHLDGDDDCLHVAIKEGKEESGLVNLTPCSVDPLAIDILPVPPHFKRGKFVSGHMHLNITYLCMADEKEMLHIKPDENSGVKWIPVEAIKDEVNEQDMLVVYEKLIQATMQFLQAKK